MVGVGNRLTHAHFLDETSALDIATVHRLRAATQGVDQTLVEEVLDHHRGIAGGDGCKPVADVDVVQVRLVGLVLEEQVDELATAGLGRRLEREAAIEAAGTQQRGIEVVGTVGRRDHEHVRRRRRRSTQLTLGREQQVELVDEPRLQLLHSGGVVERLQLHEQLVHDTAHALACHRSVEDRGRSGDGVRRRKPLEATARDGRRHRHGRGRHGQAATRHGDRVDLLDEADRSALLARSLAQRLEVGADLARGGAVVHRLERRRRDEEEGDASLGRHRLGQIGLARAGLALEQESPSRGSAHLGCERLVREEEVERADHVVLDVVDALDRVEGDVDLLRPIGHVRRTARAHRGTDEDTDEGEEEQPREQQHRVDRRPADVEDVEGVALEHPRPQVDRDEGEYGEDRREAPTT